MVDWHGVYPAVTTQFKSDQSLDLEATAAHVGPLRAGVHGLIMLGTVGENCSLEPAEKRAVMRLAVETEGRVPVLSGVAEYTTALACRFAADMATLGVDGLMVLPAMVYKSDARETLAHFRAVAGPATCRSWSTTTRSPIASTSRRRCSASSPTSRRSSRSRNPPTTCGA